MNLEPSKNWLPILAVGCLVGLCAGALVAALFFGALNSITGTFLGATPSSAAVISTPPTALASPTTAPPSGIVSGTAAVPTTFASETARPTAPNRTALPTPNFGQTYVAFDADFFADDCPLFKGSNETRDYGCEFGEYYMLHKQATTRYAYYDENFSDAVIEANGFLSQGTGKYEYGMVNFQVCP